MARFFNRPLRGLSGLFRFRESPSVVAEIDTVAPIQRVLDVAGMSSIAQGVRFFSRVNLTTNGLGTIDRTTFLPFGTAGILFQPNSPIATYLQQNPGITADSIALYLTGLSIQLDPATSANFVQATLGIERAEQSASNAVLLAAATGVGNGMSDPLIAAGDVETTWDDSSGLEHGITYPAGRKLPLAVGPGDTFRMTGLDNGVGVCSIRYIFDLWAGPLVPLPGPQ